ncbi:MAG: hypothetical protein KGI73_00090 [Patescibacteria group bacterium]|nr:hypothetical protein [Patescibacteria group bacterium]
MKKTLLKTSILGAAVLAPFSVFALSYGSNGCTAGGACNLLTTIGGLISTATPIVVAFAVLGFFWGLAVYIFSAGSDKKKKEGRNIMIYGILALFIMLSVFGIISMLQNTLQIGSNYSNGNGGNIQIPYVDTSGTGSVNGN